MKNFETKNGNENCTIVVIKLLINYKNNKNSIPPISTRYPEHREHHLSISNFIHGKIPQEITKSSPHFFPPPNAEFTWCEQRKSRGAIIPFLTLIRNEEDSPRKFQEQNPCNRIPQRFVAATWTRRRDATSSPLLPPSKQIVCAV